MDAPRDCPDCQSAGSVVGGTCQVCFSEGTPRPLRFAEVVAELEVAAALARAGSTAGVAEACRRARALLERLRGQFLRDVILAPPGTPPVPEQTEPELDRVGA
jgi:hypothetical protein